MQKTLKSWTKKSEKVPLRKIIKYRGNSVERFMDAIIVRANEQMKVESKTGKKSVFILFLHPKSCLCSFRTPSFSVEMKFYSYFFLITGLLYYKDKYRFLLNTNNMITSEERKNLRKYQNKHKNINEELSKVMELLWLGFFLHLLSIRACGNCSRSLLKPHKLKPSKKNLNQP